MFILTIRLKGAEAPIVMHYETEEAAIAGRDRLTQNSRNEDGSVGTHDLGWAAWDTFGHNVQVKPSEVSAAFVTDVAKDCEAQVRCQMIAQRAQADLNAKLQNDPAMKLRASIMGGRG